MKKREKILAGIVGGFLLLFIIGFGARGVFVKPLEAVDKQTKIIREKIDKANVLRREYFDAEDQLKSIAQRTFSTSLDEASARSGEMITHQIALAGLNEADFTRLPVGTRRMRGANEIG